MSCDVFMAGPLTIMHSLPSLKCRYSVLEYSSTLQCRSCRVFMLARSDGAWCTLKGLCNATCVPCFRNRKFDQQLPYLQLYISRGLFVSVPKKLPSDLYEEEKQTIKACADTWGSKRKAKKPRLTARFVMSSSDGL